MATKKKDAKKKKKEPGRSSQKELSDDENGDDRPKSPDKKVNFQDRFIKFCKKFHASAIPEIVVQKENVEEEDPKKKRKKSKKDDKVPRTESVGPSKSEAASHTGEAAQEELGETAVEEPPARPSTPPPPTPTIYVNYEDSKNKMNPLSLTFEAVEMDSAILGALSECLQIFKSLTSLTIRRSYFPGNLVLMLAEILRETENIAELTIDGCPHPDPQFYALIRDARSLELLTLRGCRIDDDGVKMIASELYFKEDFKEATNLLYLNLSVNLIGDRGARWLMKALRTNRTLLALTLTCNLITDVGAIALANVLKDFELVEEEILDRRNHIYHKYKTYMEMREEILEQLGVREVPGSQGAADREKIGLKRNSKKRDSKKKAQLDMKMQIKLWKQVEDVPGMNHPFVQDVFAGNKKLNCSGNLRLCHLNLSYNSITLLGVEKFLQVILYQSRLKTISQSPLQHGHTGLTNLILQGNLFPIRCPEMSQIQAYLSEMNQAGSDHSFIGETTSSFDRQRRKTKMR